MKNPKKYFEGFFSGVSRISRVWGRHSPTRFPQGQNERKANFGTVVESCSASSQAPYRSLSANAESSLTPLLLLFPQSLATLREPVYAAFLDGSGLRIYCLLHQYSDCGGVFCPPFTTTTVKKVRFGKCSGIFFDFPVLLPTTIRRCGLPKIFENRRKKSSKPFQDLLLMCRRDGRRY